MEHLSLSFRVAFPHVPWCQGSSVALRQRFRLYLRRSSPIVKDQMVARVGSRSCRYVTLEDGEEEMKMMIIAQWQMGMEVWDLYLGVCSVVYCVCCYVNIGPMDAPSVKVCWYNKLNTLKLNEMLSSMTLHSLVY